MKKTRNILVSLLACLFVILAVPTAVSAAAKAPQVPEETDSGVLLCLY